MDQDALAFYAQYAARQLASGRFLVASNHRDGRLSGLIGLDPRKDRDWVKEIVEAKTFKLL